LEISVYIPVYNGEKFIGEAIESVLGQTFNDFELIIVDDGSTDNTLSVIKSFSDPRIRLIVLPENKGNSYAANVALKSAKGKYAVRMDADDISLPDRLRVQWEFMEAHQEVLFSGGSVNLLAGNISGEIWEYETEPEKIKCNFLFRSGVFQPVSIVKLDVIKKNNIWYDEGNRHSYAEDFEFFYRLLNYGEPGNIKDVLLYYRRHEGNITKKLANKAAALKTGNFKKVLADLGFSSDEIDIESHLLLAGFPGDGLSEDKAVRVLEWADKIIRCNASNKKFNESAIEYIIEKQTDKLFYKLCDNNLKAAKAYLRNYKKSKAGMKKYFLKKQIKMILTFGINRDI
jgi:glycosyltransferase involved in cell wall biosynthesis